MLCAPKYDKPFVICVDAINVGIGGVLCQEENEKLLPVPHMSTKLLLYQRKYSVVEMEAMVVLLSLDKFSVYVEGGGGEIVFYSDHAPPEVCGEHEGKERQVS